MNRLSGLILLAGVVMPVSAQRLLSLDSCRAMALRNNKQMSISKVKQDVATNVRKSARTKYLPHVSALGTYQYTSRQVELLSDDQKSTISNLGTSTMTNFQEGLSQASAALPMENIASALSLMGIDMNMLKMASGQTLQGIAANLNALGDRLVDALDTDTRNLFAGSVMMVQPVFMGGAIIAMNKMADINEDLQRNSADAVRQSTIYSTDKAYWLVVSLKHKQKLAEGYLDLLKKLHGDVHKMRREAQRGRDDTAEGERRSGALQDVALSDHRASRQ